MKRCIAFLSLLHLATPALALTIRVGADAGCDTASLATAINQAKANPGADVIRIAANQSYTGQSLFIDSDLTLRGGYANCDAAAPSGRSTLVDSGNWAVLSLYSNTASGIDVRLEGLDISNGGASGEFGDWGGVKVGGRTRARLADLRLHHNRASFGGGLTVDSQNAIVELERRVEIDANSASIGGGIGVFAGTLRVRPHGVSIHDNSASEGGGLFVDFGLVTVGSDVEAAAGPVDGFLVRNNTASARGGATTTSAVTFSLRHTWSTNTATSRAKACSACACQSVCSMALRRSPIMARPGASVPCSCVAGLGGASRSRSTFRFGCSASPSFRRRMALRPSATRTRVPCAILSPVMCWLRFCRARVRSTSAKAS